MGAQGIGGLIAGRFASGVGLGISAIAAPVYVAEISPRERRGSNAALVGVCITFGILVSIALGAPQSPPPRGPDDQLQGMNTWYWRFLLGFPLVPALIQAALFLWVCPIDPPPFLVSRSRMTEARDLLYRIYGRTPSSSINMARPAEAKLDLQLNELKEAVALAKDVPRILTIQAIFDPYLRPAVIMGMSLAAFQQLSGINGLMAYSNSLFAQAGIAPSMLTFASTAMASANVGASLMSARVVDLWGRRRLLLLGTFFQSVSMVCLSAITGKGSVASAYLSQSAIGFSAVVLFTIFVMSFSFGLGAVTWIYLAEIYPMEIRGPALSSCGVINWLSSFVVVFCTRFMSLLGACHVYGTICSIGFVCTYMWVIETKGCSIDDSPMTPKSGRSSSVLLSPSPSCAGQFDEGKDEGEFDMHIGCDESAAGGTRF